MGPTERTKALLEKALGLELAMRSDASYREPASGVFEGEWLGAFAQPAIVLNKVTPVSLRLDATSGECVDEYGESRLMIERSAQRVLIRKQYASGSPLARFDYVGLFADGTLAGYWQSMARPEFCGVFWFSRVDRLDPATADTLRARVRRTSARRGLLQLLVASVMVGATVAGAHFPPLGLALFGGAGMSYAVLRRRTAALRREVTLWRETLGRSPAA